jgi:hypothetical protein
MSFLSPIWFFALAALSIPILVHLWNIRPGKTLKVGSIMLITEASKTTSRSLKLLDILLLILRCLLLALLAFFLAGPLWSWFAPDKKAKGWVLIPKENFKESYQKFKPQVDSLLKAGYEFHYFNKGFVKQDWQKLLADTSLKDTAAQSNYWALVKALDSKVRSAVSVYIITPNSAIHFKGEKPQTNLDLNWKAYTPADSISTFIAGAWMGNAGEIKVILGRSTPLFTGFTTETIQAGGNKDITVYLQNGRAMVSLKNADELPLAVDTSTLSIAIYTDKNTVDAGYLTAALQAVTNFNGRKAVVKRYTLPNQIPAGQTWLFWLSDEPLDNRLLAGTANVFKYESGKIIDTHTVINPGGTDLTKRIAVKTSADMLWTDGFGKAVLNREKKDNTNIYHFYTHFNPAWNDMVWSDAFPKEILKLLGGQPYKLPMGYDKRVLSAKQLLPNNTANSFKPSSLEVANPKDISAYIWLALMLVFFAERRLSHKTKSITHD